LIVVDTVEVFANVQFKTPRLSTAKMHRSLYRSFATVTDTAGKSVVDQPAIQNRLANVHDRMMHDPFLETRSRDNTLLRVSNYKLVKPAKLKIACVKSQRY
jgi:hypothetical protein